MTVDNLGGCLVGNKKWGPVKKLENCSKILKNFFKVSQIWETNEFASV